MSIKVFTFHTVNISLIKLFDDVVRRQSLTRGQNGGLRSSVWQNTVSRFYAAV